MNNKFKNEKKGEQPQGSESSYSNPGQGPISAPSISLPKGGGAIRGIGEKFAASPVTGTGSMTVPIDASPGRSGFDPQLSLSYDSGAGNGPFGFGWNLSLPSITRKTDKGLPKYQDADEPDTFILSGAEDLVPVLKKQGSDWVPEEIPDRTIGTDSYRIKRYRPRIEGLFARIERWTNTSTSETHWRSISRDNITTVYGRRTDSRIEDPEAPDGFPRVFSWLICESYDDKGNAIYYEYEPENSAGIDHSQTNERNRTDNSRSANRYLKRIKYGNKTPVELDSDLPREFREDLSQRADWLFEVVFDHEEGHYEEIPANPGDHQFINAHKDPAQDWQRRQDPFSSYRSGFEVRTYRLCHRVLMFHHFPDELGVDDYLVRSTGFKYKESPIASFITSVTQSGYKLQEDGTYLKKSLPPLEFQYSEATIQDKIQEIDEKSLENLPQGLDGTQYQWADIDGEGLSGILTEQGDSWFYKRNVSALPVVDEDGEPHTVARFAPTERLATIPSFTNLSEGRQQLLDLAGDGQLDVVEFDSPTPGFYERTKDEAWHSFKPFVSLPNISWQDPNLKFVDLTGDGHADIFITGDDAFTWYQSLAEAGFASGEKVRQTLDEEKGPKLVFADGTQSIYLADISGDGLTDLVRIRNGEVCYWPNLGYGRFGARVTMDNSPHFDSPDRLDQRRIRLADIDGSGATDIIYLKNDGVYIYLNESGNRWADAEKLNSFPHIDNLSSVIAVDLLGNGTACLVWSSPLPTAIGKPLRYIDLMGGQKPHLLVKTVNNLGAETHIHYAPSTKFYLSDKKAGKPWITRIPFPVHVVERVESYDRISRNRFVTRYAYHHGFFDGIEREFRGFGMVEQWDTEEYDTLTQNQALPAGDNIEEASHVPPVLTKTWFHTGAYLDGKRISQQFAGQYYREGDSSLGESGLSDEQLAAMLLDDTVLPQTALLLDGSREPWTLTADEEREACRALKGSILRQEVYGQDGSEEADRPYTVSESNFTIELLQAQGANPHAVFFTHERETVDFHYERKLFDINGELRADPRVSHSMVLDVDPYGSVRQSVAIGYGRRYEESDPALAQLDPDFTAVLNQNQQQTLISYTRNSYTNPVIEDDNYRPPLPCETITYELINLEPESDQPGVTNLFRFAEMQDNLDELVDVNYENWQYQGLETERKYRRQIEHMRTLYRPNDMGAAAGDSQALLPLGNLESLALPGESYQLAFTPGLLAEVYKRQLEDQPKENLLPIPGNILSGTDGDCGGYVDLDEDGHWWVPSGRVYYHAAPGTLSPDEQSEARQHFYLARRFEDPFGHSTTVEYDNHDLLTTQTIDALGNTVSAINDYRILQPELVTGPNGNQTRAAFDALGLVVGTAVMGKNGEGDSLDNFQADLTQTVIDEFFDLPRLPGTSPGLPPAQHLLGTATTRIIYDVTRCQRLGEPTYAVTLARETHVSDQLTPDGLKIQVGFTYSDGFGREIQQKIQAEPGPVPQRDAATGVILVDQFGQPLLTEHSVEPRWVGSGWTVFNNKGKPVRRYEPYFTDLHTFEFDVRIGVSPVLFYDPLERVIGTLHPNHTWEKVVFDPWRQETWDVNDTILQLDPTSDPDVGDFFSRLPAEDYLPTWYTLRTDDSKALVHWPDLDPDSGKPVPENEKIRQQEKTAAQKTGAHAGTPAVAYLDSLGRTVITIDDNGVEGKYSTRVDLDIEGNTRAVIDARKNTVMSYAYSMIGPEEDDEEDEDEEDQADSHLIYQKSMDGGKKWLIYNAAGNLIRSWDSRSFTRRMIYDELQRPMHLWVREGADAEWLAEFTVHGEGHPESQARNLRGQVFRQYDGSGNVSNEEYDFKGNLLRGRRRLASNYETAVDWSPVHDSLQPGPNGTLDLEAIDAAAAPLLEVEIFESRNRFDALNRPIQQISPHHVMMHDIPVLPNVIQHRYNEANLLNSMDIWLRRDTVADELLDAGTADRHPVKNIDYNAKGQRILIAYGNGVRTKYTYDTKTFRLTHLLTIRSKARFPGDCPDPPAPGWPGCQVQNLRYTYDPTGNIIYIRDNAQQSIFFRNQMVEPSTAYTYDALYRIIQATGREHLGQNPGGGLNQPVRPAHTDVPRVNLSHPGDGRAMGNYTEWYEYDAVGNILVMRHQANGNGGWTRCYQYADNSNRLLNTGGYDEIVDSCGTHYAAESPGNDQYRHDEHGSITKMSHLELMEWDFEDQLHAIERSTTRGYYVYDAVGERVRKVVLKNGGSLIEERIYLGGFEIFRRRNSSGLVLERETLHIMDDEQRISMVETKTHDEGAPVPAPSPLTRYQLGNHLGSASLELDENGDIISYEDYHPYGTTAYHAARSGVEVSPKRYRYTGKERDEETGLYYFGVRYYVPWLGLWMSCDPIGIEDGTNLYKFVMNNPVSYVDSDGRQVTNPKDIAGNWDITDALTRKVQRAITSAYVNCVRHVSKYVRRFSGSKRQEKVYNIEKKPPPTGFTPSIRVRLSDENIKKKVYGVDKAGRAKGPYKPLGLVDRIKKYSEKDAERLKLPEGGGWYVERGRPDDESSYKLVKTKKGVPLRIESGDRLYTAQGLASSGYAIRHESFVVIEGNTISLYGSWKRGAGAGPEEKGTNVLYLKVRDRRIENKMEYDRRIVIGVKRPDYSRRLKSTIRTLGYKGFQKLYPHPDFMPPVDPAWGNLQY